MTKSEGSISRSATMRRDNIGGRAFFSLPVPQSRKNDVRLGEKAMWKR